jgi:hypothetical protein
VPRTNEAALFFPSTLGLGPVLRAALCRLSRRYLKKGGGKMANDERLRVDLEKASVCACAQGVACVQGEWHVCMEWHVWACVQGEWHVCVHVSMHLGACHRCMNVVANVSVPVSCCAGGAAKEGTELPRLRYNANVGFYLCALEMDDIVVCSMGAGGRGGASCTQTMLVCACMHARTPNGVNAPRVHTTLCLAVCVPLSVQACSMPRTV